MSKKRKHYDSSFKSKVALVAIKGDKTTAEIAARFQIHPTMVSTWKQLLQEKASERFDTKRDNQGKDHQAEVDSLYHQNHQIGQLTVERDFLARKLNH